MAIRGFEEVLTSFPRPGDRLGYAGTWRETAALHRILPVLSDWEVAYGLTAEGVVVSGPDDNWDPPVVVTDPIQRHAILAQAAARFPELAHLRPQRQPRDPDCSACHGVGGLPQYPTMICVCGNLGWVPAPNHTEGQPQPGP